MIKIKCHPPSIIFSSPDNMKKLKKATSAFAQNYLTESGSETLVTNISNFPKLLPIFRMPEFQPESTETIRELAIAFNIHIRKKRSTPELKKSPQEIQETLTDRFKYLGVDTKKTPMRTSIEARGNWIYLKNIPEKIIPFLNEGLSYFYPDYKHNTNFKKGIWDGRKHLLKQYEDHYRCRKGLLERVILLLKSKDIQYDFKSEITIEPYPSLLAKYNGPTLWKHQEIAFTKCRAKKSGIISIATGGGKTVLMTRLTHYFSTPTNVFIDSVSVGRQLYEVFVKHLGSENVGFIGDSECEIAPHKVNIILLPTAFLALWSMGEIRRWKVKVTEEGKKEYKLKQCTVNTKFYQSIVDTIFEAKLSLYDECDILGAETYSAVSTCTQSLFNFGFSATPYRNDGKDLEIEAGCGRIIYSLSTSDLIDADILVPAEVHIYAVPRSVEIKGRMPYPSIFKACIKENSLRNLMITKIAKEFVDQRLNGIIFINRIEQGQEINKRLKQEGITSTFLHSKDSNLTRTKTITMLKKREIDVIVTTLFKRGMDIPELQFGIRGNAEGATKTGEPNSTVPQMIGRILRKDPNNPTKTKAYMVDFIDPYPYLREHSQVRIEAYKSERNFEVKFKEFKQE